MISTFGILVIAIVIVCLIAALKSKSAAIIGGSFSIAIGFFLTVFTAGPIQQIPISHQITGRAEEHKMARPVGDIPGQPLEKLPASTQSNWNKIDTAVFQAEVFPGIKPAATSLAQRIGSMVTTNSNADKLTATLTIEESISDECRFAFQEALKKQLPKAKMITILGNTPEETEEGESEKQTDAQPPGIRLTLEVKDSSTHPAAWNGMGQFETGHLTCTMFTEDQPSKQISVVFDEKPWVDRWDEFVSKHPHHRYTVCTSSDLRSSANSASQSAMQNLQEIELDAGTVYGQKIWVQANQSLIVDRFAQKLTRPYGDVWREALLIDLQGPQAQALIATAHTNHIRMAQQQRSAEHQTWWQCLLLVAVFAAVAIIGMVLNLITEGYFRGRIVGTVAVGAVIVFGTVLVVMAS